MTMASINSLRSRKHARTDDADGPDDSSTELKIALLESLHPGTDQSALLEALVEADGSVEEAMRLLQARAKRLKAEPSSKPGRQASLASFNITSNRERPKSLTKRGTTLHLYSPEDIEAYTPCSIIHNFLPSEQADELLRVLLAESPTFRRQKFKMFDRVVESPHTMW
jgi:hypothetical protein